MTKAVRFVLLAAMISITSICSAITHRSLQAVDEDGVYTNSDIQTSAKFTVEGIILNKSEEMVDAQTWQIFIQGENGDHAGTAVYMGKYNYPTGLLYSDADWAGEVVRANNRFQPGDRVRVTGLTWFYKGKTNINEQHQIAPAYNFTIDLIDPAVGLPEPEVITLDMVKKPTGDFNFVPVSESDAATHHGCEWYQGVLVRINDVNISGTWGLNGTMTMKDSAGRTFPLQLGFGSGFAKYPAPTGQIDVIGIFDQESPANNPTIGYRIWVMNYDGNGSVLTDGCGLNGYHAGDINKDCEVNFADFAEMAANWLKCSNLSYNECTNP
ncbi:MAG: hypothetical protein A2Y12_07475 [Planctomycetes bacterium GWF2_42_9]|nr:MAG: hypothetical protein A2Y12_07475 [Planctomycetes bacterium GWF2_42_9]